MVSETEPLARLGELHLAALESLETAVPGLVADESLDPRLRAATQRGHFRPAEQDALQAWFARFLTVRGALWEVMEEAAGTLDHDVERATGRREWEQFLVAYAAACLVVQLDRHLVEERATHRLVRRKLNETVPRYRIPRKQFTRVFKSLADPKNAYRMERARAALATSREILGTFDGADAFGQLAERIPRLERSLDPSRSRYLNLLFRYRLHSLRRRGASANQQASLGFLEASGRLVAELRDHWRSKRVGIEVRSRLATLLEPGDVLVTRQEYAFSNLFLPGYWPHAALYVGSPEDRKRLGIALDPQREANWTPACRVLEALKDGVRFRPLAETLDVDAVAVIRPQLDADRIAQAIARAVEHEGKQYNFDFDFFHSDRLVCTEVVYRAYDGVLDTEIPLTSRAGRPTLAAEDLLDLALNRDGFRTVALFGSPHCPPGQVVQGREVAELLAASYRSE